MWDTPREHERIAVSLEVVLEATSGIRSARISDISLGGCYVDSIGHVSIGETIFFRVHLPTGHWVQLHGEVIYCSSDSGFGLRFANLTPEENVLLEQVVMAHGGQVSPQQLPTGGGATEKPLEQAAGRSRRVLIADDDPTIRHLMTAIIQKEGYVVTALQDGKAAYDILQSDVDYFVAIFDMVMPHMNGLQLVHYMRSSSGLKHIPVGIMTAEKDPTLWLESFAAGAGIFLPKPFTPAQMIYMLNVLISQRKEVA